MATRVRGRTPPHPKIDVKAEGEFLGPYGRKLGNPSSKFHPPPRKAAWRGAVFTLQDEAKGHHVHRGEVALAWSGTGTKGEAE